VRGILRNLKEFVCLSYVCSVFGRVKRIMDGILLVGVKRKLYYKILSEMCNG
jgi:hypothetical protein